MPDNMPDSDGADDLFAGFDPALIASIRSANKVAQVNQGAARAHRTKTRHELRRAKSEKHLADILPAVIAAGDAWHVISHGDIDALSYLRHALTGVAFFERVAVSTWCIAMPDMLELRTWLDSGRIEHLELYVGEIFPSQYGDEHQAAKALVADFGARLVVALNHSKVILASNAAASVWLVMEGSANVNTNPRIEQTTITHDRSLHDYYSDFFLGLRSIERATPRDASSVGSDPGRVAPVH